MGLQADMLHVGYNRHFLAGPALMRRCPCCVLVFISAWHTCRGLCMCFCFNPQHCPVTLVTRQALGSWLAYFLDGFVAQMRSADPESASRSRTACLLLVSQA